MRFKLIDRVVERTDASLRATKAVTAAEEYLADHFAGFELLPGVMMLEALAQAGRAFVAGTAAPPAEPLVIAEVRNVKYAGMVRPGDVLTVEVTHKGADDAGGHKFAGTGTVDGQVVVKGQFTLRPMAP